MKKIGFIGFIGFIFLIQLPCLSNVAYAITPSQRAAINIWLQQQQDINPPPLSIIFNLNQKAKQNKIIINHYNIDSKDILINAKTKTKSNIIHYKRILDTTFMFDTISVKTSKYRNKYHYFSLNFKKANIDKRESYNKSKYIIFKSKTQIKYSIINLIEKLKATGTLKSFCPASPLKNKPHYLGARIKLIIYSYKMKFSGSFDKVKKALSYIENSSNYISTHNLTIIVNKNNYDLNVDLRFYQLANRRNSIDKPYVFERVNTDKICE
ncbi:MAG: hypothetical protein ACC653_10790 [Gammaproteobacteria bacterium]